MTGDGPELTTTAENHFRESPQNIVGGERVHGAGKWMAAKGKGGTRWTVMMGDGKKPIAFIAVGRVRWVSLAEVNRFGAFNLTVQMEEYEDAVSSAASSFGHHRRH
jgi:hypothetical protein